MVETEGGDGDVAMRQDKRRVLFLDGAVDPGFYRPVDHWVRHLEGTPFDAVRLSRGETIPRLDAYTHLIVTGSEASIVTPPAWIERAAATVREAVERRVALLGSCFGHQLLVYALSGRESIRRAESPEVGWVAVSMGRTDPLFEWMPDPWFTFTSHFDEVIDPPEPWKVLASTSGCAVAVIRYGDRAVWGVQPHPEITLDDALLLIRGNLIRAPERAALLASHLALPYRDDDVIGGLVRRFLHTAGGRGL